MSEPVVIASETTDLRPLLDRISELISMLTPATGGGTAQVTVDTSPVQVSTSSVKTRIVIVKADDDNTGNVYVGFDSGVSSTNGFRLVAGQAVELAIDDLSKIWLVADAVGQKVHVLWLS